MWELHFRHGWWKILKFFNVPTKNILALKLASLATALSIEVKCN